MANVLSIPETQTGINKRFLDNNEECKVLSSGNYDEFELDSEKNRGTKQSHVIWLSKEIKKDGQIEPIIVKINPKTGKKVIHGGQHRFLACKMLNIPVRYIIQNAMDDDDMVKVHVNHLAFGWKNYLDLYIRKGLEPYIRYKRLMGELSFIAPSGKIIEIGHDTLLSLLYWFPDGKKVGGIFWDSNKKDPKVNHKLGFNSGMLEFTDEQEQFVRKFVKSVDNLHPYIAPKHRHAVLRDKLLFVAIQKIWTHENWRKVRTKPESSFEGFQQLIKKLKESSDWIDRGHAYDDYLDQFERVLSYNKTRKNRVLFDIGT